MPKDEESSVAASRAKRKNPALSCAECRRLKLKCDRKFPCGACVKRGCSQICPDGSLTTGKGNRFVLANTEALHDKIHELSNRVRLLEDALSHSHSLTTPEPHPLLSPELLQIKNPLERSGEWEIPAKEKKPEDDMIDAVGSLSISHSGKSSFYGTTANSWYLLQNEDEGDTPEDEDINPPSSSSSVPGSNFTVSTDISWLNHSFPFTPQTVSRTADDIRFSLLSLLPARAKASQLIDWYYTNAAWQYSPVPRPEFDQHVFCRFYGTGGNDHDPLDSHCLALLFIVLAFGTLVDLDIPPHSPQATHYYQLSRAALSLDSVLEEPSITAIQALLCMCHFLFLANIDGPRWALMGVVTKLAQSIGLHRDSARWNLDPSETQRRRALFWEIHIYDSLQSLTFGRPPSLSNAHIDCKMAHNTALSDNGEAEMNYDAWKHRFSSECFSAVLDQAFGARPVSYGIILELDKRIRNYPIPLSLQVPGFGTNSGGPYVETQPPSVQLTMQRYIILAMKEITLLYMHRGFFARAMDDNPEDPLGSKYGQSVLSAHRSASFFVALVRSLWAQHRALTERMWFVLTHVFSCAIVLGSIPVRSPGLGMSRSALQNLEQVHELFSQIQNPRAAKVLPVLRKLLEKARTSLREYKHHMDAVETGLVRESSLPPAPPDEELATLSGKTHLVTRRQSTPGSTGSRSVASSPVVSPDHVQQLPSPTYFPPDGQGYAGPSNSGLMQSPVAYMHGQLPQPQLASVEYDDYGQAHAMSMSEGHSSSPTEQRSRPPQVQPMPMDIQQPLQDMMTYAMTMSPESAPPGLPPWASEQPQSAVSLGYALQSMPQQHQQQSQHYEAPSPQDQRFPQLGRFKIERAEPQQPRMYGASSSSQYGGYDSYRQHDQPNAPYRAHGDQILGMYAGSTNVQGPPTGEQSMPSAVDLQESWSQYFSQYNTIV